MLTGRAVSNNVGISRARYESTPRAQSLLEGALTGKNDLSIGMIISPYRFPECMQVVGARFGLFGPAMRATP